MRKMEEQIRIPAVAGLFYPADPRALRTAVSDLLAVDRSALADGREPLGLIVPHAGYVYSGRVAGAAYRYAADYGRPEAILLLGANHTGLGGPLCLPRDTFWRTPLGDVPLDRERIERLSASGIPYSDAAFATEHSMEVQLPYLQVLLSEVPPIVPISVQSANDAALRSLGDRLVGLIGRGPVWMIASSDFTHYESDAVARRVDRAALDPLLRLDVDAFREFTQRAGMSICGVGAISTMLWTARALEMNQAELLAYETSGDVTGDRSAVVGYAAVAVHGG
jgi:AmmeMemoRadiSam system protein B